MKPVSIVDITLLPFCPWAYNERLISEFLITSFVRAYPVPSKRNALFKEISANALMLKLVMVNNVTSKIKTHTKFLLLCRLKTQVSLNLKRSRILCVDLM
jgi:hypothetical protein